MKPRWTLRSALRRAGEVLRQEGLKALAFRTLGELGYRRVILFQRKLPPVPDGKSPAPGVHFRLIGDGDLRDLLALSPSCGEIEARRRLAAGHLCMLGYVDGRPAYYGWLALAGQTVPIDFLGVEAVLSPGWAYSYEVMVDPAFRGAGLAKAATPERFRLLRERGLERFVAVAVPENRAGVGLNLSAGLSPAGRIRRLRLFGLQRCWIESEIDPAPLRILSSS